MARAFIDRDGDVWVAEGLAVGGELLLACPSPQNPEDFGSGLSFPWTLTKVEAAFGPLTPWADAEESQLAAVHGEFVGDFGPALWSWQPWQVEQYLAAIARVHAEFAAVGAVAA